MLAHVRDSLLFAQLESVLISSSRERLSLVCLAGEHINYVWNRKLTQILIYNSVMQSSVG